MRAPEFGIGTAPTRADYATREIYQAGLRVAYEVDLWGRGAYEQKGAAARVKASYFSREALATSLVSEVTTTYFSVLALRERVKLAGDNLAVAESIEAALKRRMQSGDISVFDYEQQGIVTSDTLARLYELRRTLSKAEGDLAFLLGRPVSMLDIQGHSLSEISVPTVNPGSPADLLCRRPDLREAEALLAVARADVGVARKSRFPTVSLTGEAGYGVSSLQTAIAPQALFTDLVGQLAQSVFDGGRRKNDIAERQARVAELTEAYQSTLLDAMRDVEEALVGVEMTDQRGKVLDNAAERAKRLVELTNKVFNRGATDAVGLLESQRTAYRTGDLAISARLDRLRATVDVYKALGGGPSMSGSCGSVVSVAATGGSSETSNAPATSETAPAPDAAKKAKRW
jgi:NodT family efflux transporter outer membrane factor (OMF) lipoprotein